MTVVSTYETSTILTLNHRYVAFLEGFGMPTTALVFLDLELNANGCTATRFALDRKPSALFLGHLCWLAVHASDGHADAKRGQRDDAGRMLSEWRSPAVSAEIDDRKRNGLIYRILILTENLWRIYGSIDLGCRVEYVAHLF